MDAFSPGNSEPSRLDDYLENTEDKGSGRIGREARQPCKSPESILTDTVVPRISGGLARMDRCRILPFWKNSRKFDRRRHVTPTRHDDSTPPPCSSAGRRPFDVTQYPWLSRPTLLGSAIPGAPERRGVTSSIPGAGVIDLFFQTSTERALHEGPSPLQA